MTTGLQICSACGHSQAEKDKDEDESTSPSAVQQRLLTVLFCDLVDSTQLANQLGPEETRLIIRQFQSICQRVVEQMGGRITEYLGDGIVAHFTHHEANAERSINAALGINRELETLTCNQEETPYRVRCGIATGLAVIGDVLGDGRIRSESAIGLPLNLAARIQGVAKIGEVIVSDTTHQLTMGLFDVEPIGEHQLKGIDQPQPLWRIVAEHSISSRFIAHAAKLTPLIGRKKTLKKLLDHWNTCKQGQGVTVYCSGEAGIGKSRIMAEFSAQIDKDRCFQLEYQCSPNHTNTALYPLISGLEAAAGFKHNDTKNKRLNRLEAMIRVGQRNAKSYEGDLHTYANLLSLGNQNQEITPQSDSNKDKGQIFTTMIYTMRALAKTMPLCIKIEDIQWADPTTLELIYELVEGTQRHSVLLLITSRPKSPPNFLNLNGVHTIKVSRLSKKQNKKLIQNVTIGSGLPTDFIKKIVERTEGIPLFAEELSKSILDRHRANQDQPYDTSNEEHAIPTTLHDSLLARLDYLPEPSRSIVHLASVIGRTFTFNLLKQLSKKTDNQIYQLLTPLLKAQLVIQNKPKPKVTFSFRHAMVRDVAYETLLKSERAIIHLRIANILEQGSPKSVQLHPELIARHFTLGQDEDKAIEFWLNAGIKATEQFALLEAREHLLSGLNLLNNQLDTQSNQKKRLHFLVLLGNVNSLLEGATAKITRDNFSDALNLCEHLPSSKHQFSTLWGQWLISMSYGKNNGEKWIQHLLTMAGELKEPDLQLQAHHCQWKSSFYLGKFNQTSKHTKNGMSFYQSNHHIKQAMLFGGHDAKVCSLAVQACNLWFLGKLNESTEQAKATLKYAEQTQHTGSRIHALNWILLLAQYQNNLGTTKKLTTRLKRTCDMAHMPEKSSNLLCCQAIVKLQQGDLSAGISDMRHGIKTLAKFGSRENIPLYTDYLAQAYGTQNKSHEGISCIDDILTSFKLNRMHYWHAELYRRKGILLSLQKDTEQARQSLLQAYELALEQEALSLQLRAATTLFQLDNNDENKDILSVTLSKFDDGQQSEELMHANALLNDK